MKCELNYNIQNHLKLCKISTDESGRKKVTGEMGLFCTLTKIYF